MKQKINANQKKLNLLLENVSKRFRLAWSEARYEDALGLVLQATRMAPNSSLPWSDAAACYVYLFRWDEAIACATRAVELGERSFGAFDALSHAYGIKKNWEDVRKYGALALQVREQQFSIAPAIQWQSDNIDCPVPSEATKAKNIISFSLFGSNSKYCETAILNCKMRDEIYPNWTCYFYVDDSVPSSVIKRIKQAGGVVIVVQSEIAQSVPGPMWRLFAYDISDIHRVIFRDADSVISSREASAVNDWISKKYMFHHMRDAPTHTELLLAGMWGVNKGALPPMKDLLELFFKKPIKSRHFADQYFLREFVWPYAISSLLQHDSMFGFRDALDFPSGTRPDDLNVGLDEGGTSFNVATSYDNNTNVFWTLEELDSSSNWVEVCTYNGTIMNNSIEVLLPKRFSKRILEDKTMRIMLKKISQIDV